MRQTKTPRFQARHYEAIAETLAKTRPEEHWDANKKTQWALDVHYLVSMFKADNPKFSSDKFREACNK